MDNTSQCTTKIISPPGDYIWGPGPEDGNYFSENPVYVDPCDDGYGLSDGVCITLKEMNKSAPLHLIPEPEYDIIIYENCELGTILQDGVCVVTLEQESTDSF